MRSVRGVTTPRVGERVDSHLPPGLQLRNRPRHSADSPSYARSVDGPAVLRHPAESVGLGERTRVPRSVVRGHTGLIACSINTGCCKSYNPALRMPLLSGSRLGPYEILDLLGAGGMGEVYRARDTRLDRTVALKVLPDSLTSDEPSRARFQREAKAISALNHPHICALYDLGRTDGIDFLVLELLEGETLAARLARGSVPLSQVLRIGSEIADALGAAHRQGIVHRDLKPGNIMLTPTGVKLLDFGLAKPAPILPAAVTMAQPGELTVHGTIVGTLQYMAPEQVQGLEADARTDIFALGAILHEMATGRRAFEGQGQASLIAKILETDPPTVSSLVPVAPPALDQLVQRCLAKDAGDRWQSAHDLGLQLRWMQSQVSGTAIGTATKLRISQRRAWLPWTVAALCALVAAGACCCRASRRLWGS